MEKKSDQGPKRNPRKSGGKAAKTANASKANPVVLEYEDICLRKADISLLQGPRCINDNILSFYCAYMQHHKYKTNTDVLFLGPDVTECLKDMDDDCVKSILEPKNVSSKQFIFFVLSVEDDKKSDDVQWSLLVFSRPEKIFFHFDSFGKYDAKVPQNFIMTIKDTLEVHPAQFRTLRCMKKGQDYDCGVLLICMIDHIADYVNKFECIDGMAPLQANAVHEKRSSLLKLIQSMGGNI